MEDQISKLDKAISDQKKYRNLRVILISLLLSTLGVSTYSIFQYQKINEQDLKIKEKDLRINEQTLSTTTDLIKKINLNWKMLAADSCEALSTLTNLIVNTNGYGDTSIENLKNTVLASNNSARITGITSSIDINNSGTKAIIKRLDISDSTIIQLQNTLIASNGSQIAEVKKEVNQINHDVSSFVSASGNKEIESAVKLTPNIDSSLLQASQSNSGNGTSVSSTKDFGLLWVKVDYYLQYDNMRVLLQDLDKKRGIQIRVCKTIGKENCLAGNAILNNKWISYNSPIPVTIDNMKYQISLQTIDHAGNNPFKLAAFIRVIKLGSSDSSDFFLRNSVVKIYSLNSTSDKAKQIDNLLKNKAVQSLNLGEPDGYTIDNVNENQIVYYNNDQLQKCVAVKSLLEASGYGKFYIRESSGFGYKTDHFKIYVVN